MGAPPLGSGLLGRLARGLRSPWGVVALAALGAGAVAACPTCAIGIADEGHRRALGGFQVSTLFLTTVPFVVLFSVMAGLVKAVRAEEARLREAVVAPPTSAPSPDPG